ncbi:MAG TPA: class II aldolase/adducin family protein [Streptosporangiaceae bacterium]|nr:class II aldolase/adducin family protein [Streptosporangiaceae bacterium]
MMLEDERRQIVEACRKMRADGLVVGTAGNISVRVGELIAVTPSGLDYEAMTPESVGVHRLDGAPVEATLAPTTELPMHLAVYAGTDAGAVVHTHSTAATVFSTVGDELPSIHYMVALFGGPVRVASYATYGTPELAANMTAALAGRTACILGNHGTISYGADLAAAYARAAQLEWLCEVYLRACAAGTPRLLPPAEIDRVKDKLAGYGVRAMAGLPAPDAPDAPDAQA